MALNYYNIIIIYNLYYDIILSWVYGSLYKIIKEYSWNNFNNIHNLGLIYNSKKIVRYNEFHYIQKRFMRKISDITSNIKKDISDNNYIPNSFNYEKNIVFAPDKLKLGFLYKKAIDQKFEFTAKNYGMNEFDYKLDKLYDLSKKEMYKGILHPILYNVINEDDKYIEIGFTNLTSTDKLINIDFIYKNLNIEVEQVGIYSNNNYQGLTKTLIIFKIEKNQLNNYIKNIDEDFNSINNLGGIVNINNIKSKASIILQNPNTIKIDEEINIINILNQIDENIFDINQIDIIKRIEEN